MCTVKLARAVVMATGERRDVASLLNERVHKVAGALFVKSRDRLLECRDDSAFSRCGVWSRFMIWPFAREPERAHCVRRSLE